MGRARKSDILLITLDSYIWGTGWSAIKYSERQMGPIVLNLWTLGISVVVLLPFALVEYRRKKAILGPLTWHDYRDYAVMGFCGLMAMTLFGNWGAQLSTAANGAVLTMMVPILTALIAIMVLGERLTWQRIVGLIVALIGVVVISNINVAQVKFSGQYLQGDLLLLAGVLGNSIYVVYGKKLLERSSWMAVLFWGQVLGFLGSLPFLAIEPFRVSSVMAYTVDTWLSLIFMGAVFYALTMIIFFRVLGRFDAGQIMIFAYLQPVFGVVMAAVLLHERITTTMILGGLLVIAGALVVSFEKPREMKQVT